jgi:hypothetical protein
MAWSAQFQVLPLSRYEDNKLFCYRLLNVLSQCWVKLPPLFTLFFIDDFIFTRKGILQLKSSLLSTERAAMNVAKLVDKSQTKIWLNRKWWNGRSLQGQHSERLQAIDMHSLFELYLSLRHRIMCTHLLKGTFPKPG